MSNLSANPSGSDSKVIVISKYAKWLISKKESRWVYVGEPISRKSCGTKSRYVSTGMDKGSGKRSKKTKKRKSLLVTQASIESAVRRNEQLARYYDKHDVFKGRTSGKGARVIRNEKRK